MYVRIAFQAEQLRHPDRTGAAGAPKIVAQQVDDHQVFRAILGAGQEFGGVRRVFGGCEASGARAFDRAGFNVTLADFDEALRRQTQHSTTVG
ncbi:hypothetical protein D3C84_659550 [compost metagenome]